MAGNKNSGRRPKPLSRPPADLSPMELLKAIAADPNASVRERGSAARALMLQEARTKRETRSPKADQTWQEAMEAGWWCEGWHVGYGNDKTPPDHPSYGTNILHPDQPPRDPQGPKFTVKHPPEREYKAKLAQAWQAGTGERVEFPE